MNKNLLNEKDSATTEKVVSNAQSDVQLLLEQNRKTLELLEKQQVQNSLLMQRLCQQETPHGGQTKQDEKSIYDLFRNIQLDGQNFEQFLMVMEFRFKSLGISCNETKLNALLSKLSTQHLNIWQAMDFQDQSQYEEVVTQLKRVFGYKSTVSKREFWFSRQSKEESSLSFAKRIWGLKGIVEGISEQDAIEVIRVGCHFKTGDKLLSNYENIDNLLQHIDKIEKDLRLRKEVWSVGKTKIPEPTSHDYMLRNKPSYGRKGSKIPTYNFEQFKKDCIEKYGISSSEFQARMDSGVCVKCGKTRNHSAKDCSYSERPARRTTSSIDEVQEESEKMEIFQDAVKRTEVDEVHFDKDSPMIKGFINGYLARIKVDTGAAISLVSSNFVSKNRIFSTKWAPVAVNGTKISTLGESTVIAKIMEQEFQIKALVMKDLQGKDLLLSYRDFLQIGGKIWIEECNQSVDFETDFPEHRSFIKSCIAENYYNDPNKKSLLDPVKIMLKEGHQEEQIQSKPFRPSKEQKSILDKKIQVMLDQNILTEQEGATASPAFLVSKANKKDFRLLCDFRKLNEHTKDVATSIHTMEDLQDRAKGNHYFSVIDLADGFFQVELTEESKRLTGIVTQEGRYEFNVLPQGAKQSPPSFHNRIKKIIHPLKHAYNYIDDIILMSPTLEEAKEDCISLLKNLEQI